MKYLAIVFSLLFFYCSCNIEINDPLIGVWKVSDIEKVDSIAGSIKNIFGTKNLLKEGWVLELKNDGNYNIIKENGKIKEEGKWLVLNDRKTLQLTGYKIEDVVLKANDNQLYDIIQESSDLLKIKIPDHKKVMILTK